MHSYPDHYRAFFEHPSISRGLHAHGRMQWSAHCPAHDDQCKSLSVAMGCSGALLVRCHAPHGCTFDRIKDALQLKSDDFFPPRINMAGNGRKFLKSYDYLDENGRRLYQCCRTDPKGFFQRRPNAAYDPKKKRDESNPEFINNLEGVRLVLYRLPDLLKAWKEQPQRATWLVEGERDADTLAGAGLVATCNPMGALKWRPEYSETLRGRNVVIIPDEDPVDASLGWAAGLTHALEVAEQLRGVAASIKILRLPVSQPKGDVTLWWSECPGTPDEKKAKLVELARNCLEWTAGLPDPAPGSWNAGVAPPVSEPSKATDTGSVPWDGSYSAAAERVMHTIHEHAERMRLQPGVRVVCSNLELIGAVDIAIEEWRNAVRVHGPHRNEATGNAGLMEAAYKMAATLVRGIEDVSAE